MKRRKFITLLGGAAVLPIAARAQRAGKVPTIGYLGSGTPSTQGPLLAAFVQRLRQLGWTEDRAVTIEVRWAEGSSARAAEFVTDFVRRKVDVIVTAGTPTTLAAKQATAIIPIVCLAVTDPVGSGLVASLARPSTNITGLATLSSELAGKRLELLREVVPNLRRVAILFNVGNPAALEELADLERAASVLGLDTVRIEIQRANDIALPAFEALKGRAEALYVQADLLTVANRNRINTFALATRLPTMHNSREMNSGGLMSYGPNLPDLWLRAADFVDKILRGTKPADIPVEQPTRFDLVINLTTAKALGLAVPDKLLALADEVIE
jgi:putative ABC transport system substrate-binding protein